MRPLSLDIAGLHSFRERRSIDFEPLLVDRLFGIFGPTGGGKSTILDAMTLALFGKVERTKGGQIATAINSLSKECVVCLTFAVRKDEAERRYRVERLYKVLKSGLKSEARLIDLSADPPVTLADKASEVSAMIEELLGIKAHDFRLSVVLPQGAFAEFLHLSAKDRGEMLQRIFGLEEMGNRINTRLRELRSKLESEQTGTAARLESLNEYDEDALARRREELEHAIAAADAAGKNAAELEKRRNGAEELHDLIAERDRLLSGEDERRSTREELDRLRVGLDRANRAASLETIVVRARETGDRLQKAKEEYSAAKETRQKAEDTIGPLRERKERADELRGGSGRMALLEKQIRGLEGIVEVDERLALLARSATERDDTIRKSEARLHANRNAVEETRETESTAQAALDALKTRIRELDAEERNLERGLTALERLERLSARQEERKTLQENVAKEVSASDDALGKLRDSIDESRRTEVACRSALDRAREIYEKSRLGNALVEAVALLQYGEPCPLCGSVDHPHPHRHEASSDLKALAATVRDEEVAHARAIERLHALEKEESSLAARHAGTRRRLEEIEGELDRGTAEIEQVVVETEYKGSTDTETLREWLRKIAERLERKKQDRRTAEKEIESFETTLREARERVAAAREEIAKLEQAIASNRAELERNSIEAAEIEAKRSERLQELGIDVPRGTSGRALAERREELDRLRREAEEIDARYERALAALNEASREYDRCFTLFEREEAEAVRAQRELNDRLRADGFDTIDEWEKAFFPVQERERRRERAEEIADALKNAELRRTELVAKIDGRNITQNELEELRAAHSLALQTRELGLTALGKAEQAAGECEVKNAEWKRVVAESERTGRAYATVKRLSGYLQGNAFINFLADEGLQHICRTASHQLLELTGGRLAIGSRSDEGFFIRDNGNGGALRPPGSLSGGETFLVSLALSLALSDSLQVGRAPMEFFFLDEGFGTLDDDLLEIVLDSLERLRSSSSRAIGVISHVPQLRERITRRLIVTPSSESSGTNVRLEIE